jgi:hypothetical protein
MTEFFKAGNNVNSARYIETIKKPTAEGVSSQAVNIADFVAA